MKKYCLFIALLLLLAGCGKETELSDPAMEIVTETQTEAETETETETESDTTEPTTEVETLPEYSILPASLFVEDGVITFAWDTKVVTGEIEIQASDDGERFETFVTVDADEEYYEYEITEDFEVRYFRFMQGEIPSVVISVEKDEYGNYVEVIPDSDEDGLNDVAEVILGTDLEKPDTDGDGLTDYEEIMLCGTDPTVYDSVKKGVPDGEADSDGDGLSNAEEIALGTNPVYEDSDDDGLTDYEEVYTYKTDPLEADSDGDGLDDGIEVRVGLDPLNPATHGSPDASYQVTVTFDADDEIFYYVNKNDNPYRMSLEVTGTAGAVASLHVGESGYSYVMSNESILGMITEIDTWGDGEISNIKIMYEIKEGYRDNVLNLYPDEPELQGIRRLNVFYYSEDVIMSMPLDTEFDMANNIVYVETEELGTYCLVDMESWLSQMEAIMNDPRLQN